MGAAKTLLNVRLKLVLALTLVSTGAWAADRSDHSADKALLYAALGPVLHVFEVDLAGATLAEKSSITLPAEIQAGRAHDRVIHVAWSDGTGTSAGSTHGLSTLRIDPRTLALHGIGEPVALPSRPIYVSTDGAARHVLVTYTSPTGITVHRVAADGSTSAALPQQPLTLGVYGHQVLVDPTNSTAILVARGNVPSASRAEDPGELDVLAYRDGQLRNRMTVAPDNGVGFHPRYLDFHPSQPWVFVSLSQQNAIGVYQRLKNGDLAPQRIFEKNSLADPAHVQPGQLTGALHVHPNGRFVYLANRAVGVTRVDGKPVFNGGENSIAVFAVNQRTGEPTLIQTIDTRGMGPVEFAADPSGRLLLVANMTRLWIRDQASLTAVPPSLAVFRVRDDGTLEFVRKHDLESGERTLFWMGLAPRS